MYFFIIILSSDIVMINVADEGRLPRSNRDTFSIENKRRGISFLLKHPVVEHE